jgi:hypothetical protein
MIANTDPNIHAVIVDENSRDGADLPVLAWADDGHPMVLDFCGLVRVEDYRDALGAMAAPGYYMKRITLGDHSP